MHWLMSFKSIIVIIFVVQLHTSITNAHCDVTIKTSYHRNSPLFLDYNMEFAYPTANDKGVINYKWFQDRLVFCPGSELKLKDKIIPSTRASRPRDLPLVIRCIDGDNFEIEDGVHTQLALKDLKCTKTPKRIDGYTGTRCKIRGEGINLGYKLGEHIGKGVITACYDDIEATTLWATSTIRSAIADYQMESKQPTFSQGILFKDISVNEYYKKCMQLETFINIFYDDVHNDDDRMDDGFKEPDVNEMTEQERQEYEEKRKQVAEYVSKYISFPDEKKKKDKKDKDDKGDNNGDEDEDEDDEDEDEDDDEDGNGKNKKPTNYFQRGHLIARADMFYAAEQYATYLYVNVLPQWRSINNGNWKDMEGLVRKLAAIKGDLNVWAGGIGTLTLENHEIYLGRRKGQSKPVLPAPKFMYKMVYSRQSHQGIVFISVNNPYLTDEEIQSGEYEICPTYDFCTQKKPEWANNIRKGYIYCCEIHDFLDDPYDPTLGLETEHIIPPNVTALVW